MKLEGGETFMGATIDRMRSCFCQKGSDFSDVAFKASLETLKRIRLDGDPNKISKAQRLLGIVRTLVDYGVAKSQDCSTQNDVWLELDVINRGYSGVVVEGFDHEMAFLNKAIELVEENPPNTGGDAEDILDWRLTFAEMVLSKFRLEFMYLAILDLGVPSLFEEEKIKEALALAEQAINKYEPLEESFGNTGFDEEADWKEEQEAAALLRQIHQDDPSRDTTEWVRPKRNH